MNRTRSDGKGSDPSGQRSIFFNNILLLGFEPGAMESKHSIPFTKDIFAMPNKKAFEVVMYFLLNRLNPALAKERFRVCYPVCDKKQEQLFRRAVSNWLIEITKDDHEAYLPRVAPSLLMSPSGDKFYNLLLHLSAHVLMRVARTSHSLKNRDLLQRPRLVPSSIHLGSVMVKTVGASSVRHRKRFLEQVQDTTAMQDQWAEYAAELTKEHRTITKSIRGLEQKLQDLYDQANHLAKARGSPPPVRRRQSGDRFEGEPEVQAIRRTKKVQKVRELWKSVNELYHTQKPERDVLQSILDGAANRFKLDASDINVHIPEMLLRDCEKELQRRNLGNTYEGGKLNLLTLIQLWNLSLHLYLEQLNQVTLPDFGELAPTVVTQVHDQHTHLANTQALRSNLANELLPQLKESIAILTEQIETLEDSTLKQHSSLHSSRNKFDNLTLLPSTPPVSFQPDTNVKGATPKEIAHRLLQKSPDIMDTPEAATLLRSVIDKAALKHTGLAQGTPVSTAKHLKDIGSKLPRPTMKLESDVVEDRKRVKSAPSRTHSTSTPVTCQPLRHSKITTKTGSCAYQAMENQAAKASKDRDMMLNMRREEMIKTDIKKKLKPKRVHRNHHKPVKAVTMTNGTQGDRDIGRPPIVRNGETTGIGTPFSNVGRPPVAGTETATFSGFATPEISGNTRPSYGGGSRRPAVGGSRGPTVGGSSRGPTVGGSSRGPTVGGSSRGPKVGGSSRGPTVGGSSRGPTVGGSSRGPTVGGSSRGSTVGGSSRGPTIDGSGRSAVGSSGRSAVTAAHLLADQIADAVAGSSADGSALSPTTQPLALDDPLAALHKTAFTTRDKLSRTPEYREQNDEEMALKSPMPTKKLFDEDWLDSPHGYQGIGASEFIKESYVVKESPKEKDVPTEMLIDVQSSSGSNLSDGHQESSTIFHQESDTRFHQESDTRFFKRTNTQDIHEDEIDSEKITGNVFNTRLDLGLQTSDSPVLGTPQDLYKDIQTDLSEIFETKTPSLPLRSRQRLEARKDNFVNSPIVEAAYHTMHTTYSMKTSPLEGIEKSSPLCGIDMPLAGLSSPDSDFSAGFTADDHLGMRLSVDSETSEGSVPKSSLKYRTQSGDSQKNVYFSSELQENIFQEEANTSGMYRHDHNDSSPVLTSVQSSRKGHNLSGIFSEDESFDFDPSRPVEELLHYISPTTTPVHSQRHRELSLLDHQIDSPFDTKDTTLALLERLKLNSVSSVQKSPKGSQQKERSSGERQHESPIPLTLHTDAPADKFSNLIEINEDDNDWNKSNSDFDLLDEGDDSILMLSSSMPGNDHSLLNQMTSPMAGNDHPSIIQMTSPMVGQLIDI